MSRDTFKQILGIQIWKFTDTEIYQSLQKRRSSENAMKWLPEYCLREDTGYVDNTDYYLQFRMEGDKEWWLFNILYADSLLQEEISNIGIKDVLHKVNLIPIFKRLEWNRYEDYQRILPLTSKLVIEVTYIHTSGPDGDDYDGEVKLVGYMDKELNVISI